MSETRVEFYGHYSEVAAWHWPSFTPAEIACKGSGELLIDFDAMDRLQALRNAVGVPVVLNSAYRSEAHNKAVGGAPKSMHRLGRAFDVKITPRLSRETIKQAARAAGFSGFGDYNSFVHIDTGKARHWDFRK